MLGPIEWNMDAPCDSRRKKKDSSRKTGTMYVSGEGGLH